MKRVICINARNYRLTVNREYEVEVLSEGWYQVINDAGRSVRYSSELFRDVVIESTEDEILRSLRFNIQNNELLINFIFDGNNVELRVNKLEEEGTNISCGIRQLHGINGFTSGLLDVLSPYNRGSLINTIIRRAYQYIIDNTEDCAFLLLSTNTNDNNFTVTENVLDDIAEEYSFTEINPNSDNEIILWIVNKENL